MKRRASQSYKSTPYKRPRQLKSGGTTKAMVKKDASDYRILRSFRPDYKVTDAYYSIAPSTTPSFLNIYGNLTQGTGWKDNYVGREISPIGLDCRIHIYGSSANAFLTADYNNQVRFLIFQWMDDAAVTSAGLFESNISGLGYLDSPIDMANYNNIEVLHDETVSLWALVQSSTFSWGTCWNKRIYIKANKMRNMEFNTTVGNVSKGGLFCCVQSDSANTPHPLFYWHSRLTFLDV